ncbi:MAG: hypothetical protein ABI076_07825 [Acidobacteriaceae bacterium]
MAFIACDVIGATASLPESETVVLSGITLCPPPRNTAYKATALHLFLPSYI